MDPSHLVFKQSAEFRLAYRKWGRTKGLLGTVTVRCLSVHTHTYLDLQRVQKPLQHYYEGTELLFPRWEKQRLTEAEEQKTDLRKINGSHCCPGSLAL